MRLSEATEKALVACVRDIAAQEILPRFGALDPTDIAAKSRADDLVTIADREAERCLTEAMSRILPGAAVIGEEAVSENAALRDEIAVADRSVIIDPVDGTWNFAHALPLFGVIIAIAERGETIWGLIYDPVGDDWAIASKGQGARLESASGKTIPLKLEDVPGDDASSLSGYAHAFLAKGDERRRMFDRLTAFHRVDALRCSAHEYRLLGRGAVDFCLSGILNPWDHAAGCLIAEEAGGVARMLDGRPYRPDIQAGRVLAARSESVWNAVAGALDGA